MMHSPELDDPDGLDPEETPKYCRMCDGLLADDPNEYLYWNGWFWCVDHGREMQRLAQGPDHVDQVRR
jgi:hypothetical protein